MSTFLLLLLASLMCCANASENINKEEIVYRRSQTSNDYPTLGGETEQNPNDPEYQKMARELVFDHMRVKKEVVKKISVLKVTTQIVSGTITSIKLRILFRSGKTINCDTKTEQQPWKKVKSISYTCIDPKYSKPSLENQADGADLTKLKNYKKIAQQAVENYFKNRVVERSDIKSRIIKRKLMYLTIDVILRRARAYICSLVLVLPKLVILSIECIEKRDRPGGNQWQDPTNKKYFEYAEKSLLKVKDKFASRKHETIVTFVKKQVVAGSKHTIDFIVLPDDGGKYKCQTRVWEKTTGQNVIQNVKCRIMKPLYNDEKPERPDSDEELEPPNSDEESESPNNEEEPEPPNSDDESVTPNSVEESKPQIGNEAKYNGLGKASIKDYFKNQPDKKDIANIKIINIAYVTTHVHRQKIMYINFDVSVRHSNNHKCSVLFVIPSYDSLSTNCFEDPQALGGYQWVDPSKKKYLDLAEKSFLNSMPVGPKLAYDTIVTFVVQQVVSGFKNSINFILRPIHGHEYECLSHVWEQTSGHDLTEDVTCRLRTQVDQPNGDEAKYGALGKAAVEDYFKNQPEQLDVAQIKIKNIAFVTTSLRRLNVMYINFDVTVAESLPSKKYICSVVFKIPSHNSLSTKCVQERLIVGGFQWKDPSQKKYLDLAEKSFIFNQKLNGKKLQSLKGHDTIVTFVEQQIVSGHKDRIDFIVIGWPSSQEYECATNIWEMTEGKDVIEDIKCQLRRKD